MTLVEKKNKTKHNFPGQESTSL